MTNYNDEELTIILAMYYFDNNRLNSQLLNDLTIKFNRIFKKDINSQNIGYEISTFKNVDPSFNNDKIEVDEIYYRLWNYYIDSDRIKELQSIYRLFKKEEYVPMLKEEVEETYDIDEIIIDDLNKDFSKLNSTEIDDLPFQKYDKKEYASSHNKRSVQVMLNALARANYCCEFSKEHKSFMRKHGDLPYTEGHHLVPLKHQNKFDYNLDVEANVVSLCSECHNKIHYGRDNKEIIENLYNKRKERLEKCNIIISLDELLKMYE